MSAERRHSLAWTFGQGRPAGPGVIRLAQVVVPLAHFGHWYVSLPIYLGPVIAVALFLAVSDWRQRRRTRN